ncbi:MAG: hypothetical protein JWP15_2179, partial [Alphaproteobacteria bacterium]|nr:hypothetical protein [Alphaproteobacteria bacterium]
MTRCGAFRHHLLLVPLCLMAGLAGEAKADRCDASPGLSFICGAEHPEDLAPIPG